MEVEGILEPQQLHGFKRLRAWHNAAELRKKVFEITSRFPKCEMRRISQMQDAARSVKQNIQEAYHRYSISEYIHGLNIARGSLAEVAGDIDDCFDDKLLGKEDYEGLKDLCARTGFLLDRLMQSLRKKREDGSWVKFSE
jgi:four helix bundle protein